MDLRLQSQGFLLPTECLTRFSRHNVLAFTHFRAKLPTHILLRKLIVCKVLLQMFVKLNFAVMGNFVLLCKGFPSGMLTPLLLTKRMVIVLE